MGMEGEEGPEDPPGRTVLSLVRPVLPCLPQGLPSLANRMLYYFGLLPPTPFFVSIIIKVIHVHYKMQVCTRTYNAYISVPVCVLTLSII